ncbi:MAG: chemotaxis protein CheW [Halothiobacillaceae bacterium]
MSMDMSQFYQVFFDEAAEHLANMEGLLLNVDVNAPDLEELNAIFRAAHSIKGGAGTFGFTDMAQVTHVLETLLDKLRKEEFPPTDEMIDAFLRAGDVLKSQLAAHQGDDQAVDPDEVEAVCATLERLSAGGAESAGDFSEDAESVPSASPEPQQPEPEAPPSPVHHWLITFESDEHGPDEETRVALYDDLRELGQLEVLDSGAPHVHRLRLVTTAGAEVISDSFAFVLDADQVHIEEEPEPEKEDEGFGFFDDAPGSEHALDEQRGYGFFDDAPGHEALEDARRGYGLFKGAPGVRPVEAEPEDEGFGFFEDAPGSDQVKAVAEAAQRAGRDEPGTGSGQQGAKGGDPGSGTKKPAAGGGKGAAPARKNAASDSSIRVSVEKVDSLINLVGELVITHAMLAESASDLDPVMHERIFDGLSNLERNSRDLQQAVMSIRMMPISFVFSRFPRVVRDTASSLNKKVELKLIGEDTELDKGLIEKLADPLNHLVRNSIDHGIEPPEKRIAAGKPEKGEIILRASHQGGNIVIEISDDGAGLSREKLLAKAAERGLAITDSAPDKEVWQLIFAAGFSTAEKVTDISGRGVGMDVVRRNIESMNGRIEIESKQGEGTRILIRLPLTLAILDGMSIRVGDEIFIVPLTAILESLQPQPEQLKTVTGKGRVVHVRGEYLPLVALHQVFHVDARYTDPREGIVVIVESTEGRAAVLVDELVAQHQVVIKSLEENYRKVRGVSGATIMGDGRVALILDVDELVRLNQDGAPSADDRSD